MFHQYRSGILCRLIWETSFMAILFFELKWLVWKWKTIQEKTDKTWKLNQNSKRKNKYFELEVIMKHINAGQVTSWPQQF